MRILELYLKNYHVLQGFGIEFEKQNNYAGAQTNYKLDLIVGVNGTGKTTLLRSLATLFQIFESNITIPQFGFRLKYRLHEETDDQVDVIVSNLDEQNQRLPRGRLTVHSNGVPVRELDSSISSHLRPDLVVAFTSGSEEGWQLDFSQLGTVNGDSAPILDPQSGQTTQTLREWYLREVPGGQREASGKAAPSNTSNSNFLFIQQRHLPLVILCGLLTDMEAALQAGRDPEELKHHLREALQESSVKALRGFSLKFRMNRATMAFDDLTFIARLSEIAHHTVQTGSDYLLVFDLQTPTQQGQKHLVQRLIDVRGNGLELFRRLLSLAEPGGDEEPVLRETHLFLEREYKNEQHEAASEAEEKIPLHLLNWLSDGEISFLGRLCLLSLLRKQEALLLLDEPEVHFNDYWKRQLVHMLDQTLQEEYCHVLMTTHSSITLSDVLRRDIWILKRRNNHTSDALPPPIRTLGADPSDIMMYVFGAQTASGAQSAAYIQRKIEVADNQKELKDLLDQVGPSQWRYLIRRRMLALEEER